MDEKREKERKRVWSREREILSLSLSRKFPSSPERDSFYCELSMPPVWTINFLSFHFGCRFQLHNPSVNRPPSRFVTPPSLPSFGSAGSASPQPNCPPTHRIYSPLPILGMQIPTLAANWVNMVSVMRFWLATWQPQPLKPCKSVRKRSSSLPSFILLLAWLEGLKLPNSHFSSVMIWWWSLILPP